MNIDQLVPYFVLATPVLILLALVICAVLVTGLRRQLRQLSEEAVETRASVERLAASIAPLQTVNPNQLEQRLSELESRKPTAASELSSPGFVGASRRGQVLRLARSGESAAHIAEALGVSQGEVQLTLKLQDLYSRTIQ